MGIWGVKLYDNDCAADIKDLFLDLTDAGLSPVEAAEQIEAEFPEMFQDSEDGPMAQVILADLLWKRGCLEDERKGKALAWLESGGDLARWKHEAPRRAAARQRNLEKLYQQLFVSYACSKTAKGCSGSSAESNCNGNRMRSTHFLCTVRNRPNWAYMVNTLLSISKVRPVSMTAIIIQEFG